METKMTSLFNRNPHAPNVDSNREHALLIALIASEQERFYTNSLTTGAGQDMLDALLLTNSKIKDKSRIQLMFSFLKEEGERCAYNIMIPLFLSETDEEKRDSAIQKQFMGIERLVKYSKSLNGFLKHIRQDKILDIKHEDLQRGILAWDLSKMIILARIAFDQQLITEKEAWEYIEFADKKCRQHFTSWEEIGKSYLLGQVLNYPEKEDIEKVIRYYHSAIENVESPWVKVPF